MSSIVVPSRNGRSGWRDLNRILMSMLGRKFTAVKGRKDTRKLNGEDIQLKGLKDDQKNWRLAVVVYRSSIDVTWKEIKGGLCWKLGRQVEFSALHANIAILWCRNEAEKRLLLCYEFCNLPNTRAMKVVNWSQKEHWEEIVFEGKNSCVGIEGIPLNWWNIHVFKVIGAKLGGFLEIDKETIAFSFLNYAKIRVLRVSKMDSCHLFWNCREVQIRLCWEFFLWREDCQHPPLELWDQHLGEAINLEILLTL